MTAQLKHLVETCHKTTRTHSFSPRWPSVESAVRAFPCAETSRRNPCATCAASHKLCTRSPHAGHRVHIRVRQKWRFAFTRRGWRRVIPRVFCPSTSTLSPMVCSFPHTYSPQVLQVAETTATYDGRSPRFGANHFLKWVSIPLSGSWVLAPEPQSGDVATDRPAHFEKCKHMYSGHKAANERTKYRSAASHKIRKYYMFGGLFRSTFRLVRRLVGGWGCDF